MKKTFVEEVKERWQKELGLTNILARPKILKIVLSLRVGRFKDDAKALEAAAAELRTISGQKAIATHAKKSISAFKLREGDLVGYKVTLRGEKMWSFLCKFVKVVLPSVRDFTGVKASSLDGRGNLTIGFVDQTVFPEIDANKVDRLRGLSVGLSSTAGNRGQAQKFFESLGIVFGKPPVARSL